MARNLYTPVGLGGYAAASRSSQPAATKDPLGIGVIGRGLEHRRRYEEIARREDPFSSIGFGSLPMPQWEGFKQALTEQGVRNVRGGYDPRLPSNALRGLGVGPGSEYLTLSDVSQLYSPLEGRSPVIGGGLAFPRRSSALAGLRRARPLRRGLR